MHLLFVSVVVFLQITDYLLLKFFILDELSYFMGTAGIVLRNNDSVDTLFNLAVCRGIVGRNDRLTQYLCFAYGNGISFEPGRLYINVACFDEGVRIFPLSQKNDVFFHARFFYLFLYQLFISTIAYDIPVYLTSFLQYPSAYIGLDDASPLMSVNDM